MAETRTPKIPRILLSTGCYAYGISRTLKSGSLITACTDRQARLFARRARKAVAEPVETGATRYCFNFGGPELLPGIPNDVTINVITPKLCWRDLPVLSSISKSWLHAIESRQVYDARVRCHSTQPLIPIITWSSNRHTIYNKSIVLYCKQHSSFFELPAIPHLVEFPDDCGITALDGKVYVMGGRVGKLISNKVFVFDLAGKREWRELARMNERRECFGCGILDGMIYVFGGRYRSPCGSELYDPVENTWHSITPMLPLQTRVFTYTVDSRPKRELQVAAIGGELVVHAKIERLDININLRIYHPVKKEWRTVLMTRYVFRGMQARYYGRLWEIGMLDSITMAHEVLFEALGKLYSMSDFGIYVCEIEKQSWQIVHAFSFPDLLQQNGENRYPVRFWPVQVFFVDGELLVVAADHFTLERFYPLTKLIFQSRGFGYENQELTWELKGEMTRRAEKFGPCLSRLIQL